MTAHLSPDERLWLVEMIDTPVDLTDHETSILEQIRPVILAAAAEMERRRAPWWRRWFR